MLERLRTWMVVFGCFEALGFVVVCQGARELLVLPPSCVRKASRILFVTFFSVLGVHIRLQ
jgi:hypothetical protein